MGLIIDSNLQRIELPKDKLDKLAFLSNSHSKRRSVKKRDFEVIVGHMNFASKAIYGARLFARVFINALNSVTAASHHITLNRFLRDELKWWEIFASTMNGLVPCRMGDA